MDNDGVLFYLSFHNSSTSSTHIKNYFSSTQAMWEACRKAIGSHDDHDNFDGSPHSSPAPSTSNKHPNDTLNKGGIDGIKLSGLVQTQQ